jgi:hypothetical protein
MPGDIYFIHELVFFKLPLFAGGAVFYQAYIFFLVTQQG